MQILYGPAPRFRLVQEVLLPILQALKIKPAPQADGQRGRQADAQTDRQADKQAKQEARGRLGQRGSLGEGQAFVTKAVIKPHNKAQLHHTASIQKPTSQQSKHTPAFDAFLDPFPCLLTHVNSAAGSAAQPSSFANSRDSCECVRQYSHDGTLGKGEVLHQDVQTSVLIVEELPDPPAKHGEGQRDAKQEQHTHSSVLQF